MAPAGTTQRTSLPLRHSLGSDEDLSTAYEFFELLDRGDLVLVRQAFSTTSPDIPVADLAITHFASPKGLADRDGDNMKQLCLNRSGLKRAVDMLRRVKRNPGGFGEIVSNPN